MEEKNVYLLYEGDEWLSTDSLVLMGIFTSEEKLKENAKKLIRQRAKKHLKTAEQNSIYDFEYPDNDEENINIVVEGMMAELMNNGNTNGWDVNYSYTCAELDKLEEI